MKQETDLRKTIAWYEKLENDESVPKETRVNAGIEKVKLIHKLKNLLWPKPTEI